MAFLPRQPQNDDDQRVPQIKNPGALQRQEAFPFRGYTYTNLPNEGEVAGFSYAEKEVPQPHVLDALGLLKENPRLFKPST